MTRPRIYLQLANRGAVDQEEPKTWVQTTINPAVSRMRAPRSLLSTPHAQATPIDASTEGLGEMQDLSDSQTLGRSCSINRIQTRPVPKYVASSGPMSAGPMLPASFVR